MSPTPVTGHQRCSRDDETVLDTGGRVELADPLPVSFTIASLFRRR